ELDAGYGEAFYVLGLIYRRTGHLKLAEDNFEKARVADMDVSKRSGKKRQTPTGTNLLALCKEATPDARVLMTAGDERLVRALRQDALKTFSVDAENN
ncbi:MAG TPA: hypothetical protein VFH31_07985, partial [Pyrinomonadaceae bacterium]|nr:hypothetical protein [Pyrinomonadaceae bacterium]